MSNAVDGVVAVAGIGDHGNGSACLNLKLDLCALVELRITASGGKLTYGSVDGKTVPFNHRALNIFSIGV